MDVIHAIGSPMGGGTAPRAAGRWWRRVGARVTAFVRHPVRFARAVFEELPYDYPPSVIVSADLALLVVAGGAAVQRHEYFPTAWPLLAVALVFAPVPLMCFFGITPRPAVVAACGLGATGLFLVQPVSADFAPFVLVVSVGEIAAIAAKRWSALFAVVAVAALLAFDLAGNLHWDVDGQRLEGVQMYVIGVVLGWLVGVMLQYQRKFLYQERQSQAVRAARAADEERRRIAREVHDVIAHSLSVTLLHLTAARHALQTDRDVDDAVEALVDAERLGRQAMADIRRTVGLLDAGGPARQAPEPGISDISDLVADFARAGLDVRGTVTGDLDAVSPAVGLALYRIGQESLANVVKHAREAEVTVRLEVNASTVALAVDNTLPVPVDRPRGVGMGLSGMRQRAELLGGRLSTGPFDDGWAVRAEFPVAHGRGWPCLLPVALGGSGGFGLGTRAAGDER